MALIKKYIVYFNQIAGLRKTISMQHIEITGCQKSYSS